MAIIHGMYLPIIQLIKLRKLDILSVACSQITQEEIRYIFSSSLSKSLQSMSHQILPAKLNMSVKGWKL